MWTTAPTAVSYTHLDVYKRQAEIPAGLADDVSLLRDITVENIAESDEVLMEKYLEEGSLSLEDLHSGLRSGVVKGELTPVLTCSALENKGGQALLAAIEALLPSPLDRPPFEGQNGETRSPDPDAPVACFAFKTLADPFAGQLTLLRVLSGTINGDANLKNMRTEDNERLGSMLYLTGKNQTPCKEPVGPGAIVAVAKLKNTRTGDTRVSYTHLDVYKRQKRDARNISEIRNTRNSC